MLGQIQTSQSGGQPYSNTSSSGECSLDRPLLTRQRLRPLAVPVGLPPVGILPVDDVQDVAALERDPELVARDVEVVVRVVGEVSTIVILKIEKLGCRHSSVESCAPSILPPQGSSPKHTIYAFSIDIVQIVYLSFELECEKNENKQNKAGIGPFLKKIEKLLELLLLDFLFYLCSSIHFHRPQATPKFFNFYYFLFRNVNFVIYFQ